MKCFKCGMDVPAGSQFCSHCGSSMAIGQAGGAGGQSQGNQSNVNPGNQGNMNPRPQVYGNQGNVNPGFSAYGNQSNMNLGVPVYGNQGNMNPGTPIYGNRRKGDIWAVWSMVLGITSFISCCIMVFISLIVDERRSQAYNSLDSFYNSFQTYRYQDGIESGLSLLMILGIICGFVGFIFAICSLVKGTKKKAMAIIWLIFDVLLFIINFFLGALIISSL